MITRRTALAGLAGTATLAGLPAYAQTAPLYDQLRLFVPANPGGGWDQTARVIELVAKAEGLIGNAQITNQGGAGGLVGLPTFVNQWRGQGNSLMVAGMVMVGAIIANKAPVSLKNVTPIARLTGESLALVVPAASPMKTAADFAAALRADPSKVATAGGSAGGSDHILLGLIGKSLGVAASRLAYVPHAGGGAAVAAILGGHVQAGISGVGEFIEHVKSGRMRMLAISGTERVAGLDVPTLREAGIDVDLFNWRGVFAPAGVTPAQRDAMIAFIERLTKSARWGEEMQKRDWSPILLTGDAYGKYLDSEFVRIEGILKDIGLA